MTISQADYVIVGGGSAGCVLASRLSEDRTRSVILIEAGGRPDSERFRIPGAAAFNLGKPPFDWCYQTPPDPTIDGRRYDWSAGKVLGGGSSLNGLVYIRGLPSDFDRWDRLCGGNSGWRYQDMLPYFKKAEHFMDRSAEYLGAGGPLGVSSVREPNPLMTQFLHAATEMGYRATDLNGPAPEGFGPADSSQQNGRRASTYETYLKAAFGRPNLQVLTGAEVRRIAIEGCTAKAVDVVIGGAQTRIVASREIIVAAGAIGSPTLLQRSGIGARQQLAAAGIDPVHELPGVGANLQEHAGAGIGKYVNVTTMNSQMGPLSGLRHAARYYLKKTGPLASPIVQAMGFVRSSPELAAPDLQFHFLPFAYIIGPESRSAMTAYQPKQNAMLITVTLCQPKTRGSVRLASAVDAPVVDHQLFGNHDDIDTLIAGLKIAEEMYRQPSLKPFVVAPCSPDKDLQDDAEWEAYVRARANIAYHFSGTCKMGNDALAVVDTELKVHGLDGLRVVDASIMPTVTSGNTNASTIAIAEKAADMICAGSKAKVAAAVLAGA